MRFSKTHKRMVTAEGLFIVKDVYAKDLKKLKIPYKIYRDGYNYDFLVEKRYLPRLIKLVEPRHQDYWKEEIRKTMR